MGHQENLPFTGSHPFGGGQSFMGREDDLFSQMERGLFNNDRFFGIDQF